MCFGLLSCWKQYPDDSSNLCALWLRLRFRIFRIYNISINISINSRFAVPEAIQPHNIIQPPPCSTIGLKFLYLSSVLGSLQTVCLPSDPKLRRFVYVSFGELNSFLLIHSWDNGFLPATRPSGFPENAADSFSWNSSVDVLRHFHPQFRCTYFRVITYFADYKSYITSR